MRSLREIYEQIEEDEEINLFCLYVDHEPLTFQEAKEEDCWQSAMKEEIRGEHSSVITKIIDQKSKPEPEPNQTALVRFDFGFVLQKPNSTEPNRISYPIYHPTQIQ